jgi:RND superfamily putative drug exporter
MALARQCGWLGGLIGITESTPVPSTMELLGDRNWWMPRWLDRILPHLDVERHRADPAARVEVADASEPEPERVLAGTL